MLVYDILHLTKIYPGQARPANDDITLQIAEGEIFGLLGDNGAGKSTLVRQLANLLASTSGDITLFGQPVGRDPFYVPRHVGYMPQDRLALNNLTVGEALYFTAHLRGLSRPAANGISCWSFGVSKTCNTRSTPSFRAVRSACCNWRWPWPGRRRC
jgi:ABC-type multidrug transport system ATPase subunit